MSISSLLQNPVFIENLHVTFHIVGRLSIDTEWTRDDLIRTEPTRISIWKPIYAGRSSATNFASTISRSWRSKPGKLQVSRRSCAGNIRSVACCCPPHSLRLPKKVA